MIKLITLFLANLVSFV